MVKNYFLRQLELFAEIFCFKKSNFDSEIVEFC